MNIKLLTYLELSKYHPIGCEVRYSVEKNKCADYCWGLGLALEKNQDMNVWRKHCLNCEFYHGNKEVIEL